MCLNINCVYVLCTSVDVHSHCQVWPCKPMTSPPGSSLRGIFPARILEQVCHFLLQGIFATQRSNPCLLHWQADSLSLCHLGSPKYNVSYRVFRFISIKLRQLLSIPSLLIAWVMNSYWIFPNAFSASIDVIIWFFFFNLLIWWIILIDSQILS